MVRLSGSKKGKGNGEEGRKGNMSEKGKKGAGRTGKERRNIGNSHDSEIPQVLSSGNLVKEGREMKIEETVRYKQHPQSVVPPRANSPKS